MHKNLPAMKQNRRHKLLLCMLSALLALTAAAQDNLHTTRYYVDRIREFARLGFVLLNEENHDVILPLQTEPSFIPNAAEIYVVGRDVDNYFRADAVIIPNTASDAAPRILTFEN